MPDVRNFFYYFSIAPSVHVEPASPMLGLKCTHGTALFERLVGAINLPLCFQIMGLSQQLLLTLVAVTYSCY